jgi:hydroxysqualene synthase
VVDQAYAACLRIAREHYENFPVASWLVPKELRPHVAAIYAFARGADDIADEPGRTAAERLALLDTWHRALHQPPQSDIFEALHHTRQEFELPNELFEALLSAFRQDVVKTRYATWEELFDYCRRSANPVGRLVLRLAGVRRDDADAWSDAVCTALQLTNFWQDLEVDWGRGRLYVPQVVWEGTAADPADLDRRRWTAAWRAALQQCADRTEHLFRVGRPVCDVLPGRLGYELRATWLGGTRVLDKLHAVGFDVFARRPRLTRADLIVIGLKSLTWRATPRSTTPS